MEETPAVTISAWSAWSVSALDNDDLELRLLAALAATRGLIRQGWSPKEISGPTWVRVEDDGSHVWQVSAGSSV
jgi:hypothetical protein